MPDGAMPPLRLRARDGEDLAVLSAALQDAIVPVHDMTFLARERRFVMAVNRFRWEVPAALIEGGEVWQRTLCGVRFEAVDAVKTRGLDLHDRARMLDLLAITSQEGCVLVAFADGATLRLEGAGIDVALEDRGEAWPTPLRPRHPD